MKFYLLTLFLFLGITLHAQNKGTISGIVLDSEQRALEKATVSLLNEQDSSVISYTLADDKGSFKLYKIPLNQRLKLIISHVGTSPYAKELKLTSEDEYKLDTIILDENILNEVQITAQPPVRLNNDTLEYNANYFKTRPDASVEELMKKLPGLQVNLDGSIYYQGKEVSKVLVNGKEFFAQDLRIATRNLDAAMVALVQVYRDKGDSKQVVEDETTLPITINLKFKKELVRADFGKFYGSGGTQDRYESGILLNTFRDTLQISFIGFGNNINRQSFDYSELSQHAGLNRSENYGFSDFGGRNYSGIQNDISGGVNVNYDWGKITKLNIMYQYSYGDELDETKSENESFFDQTTQSGLYEGKNTNRSHKNMLSGRFNHKFDTTAFIRYSPKLAFNKTKSGNNSISSNKSLNDPVNDIVNTSNNNNQDMNYNHDLFLEKSFNPKLILSLSNNLYFNSADRDGIVDRISTIYSESSDPKRRVINSRNETGDLNSKTTSNLQVKFHKNFTTNFSVQYNYLRYDRNEELALAIDNGNLVQRDDSENDLRFTTKDYGVGGQFTWTIIKDLSLQAGLKSIYKHNTFDYYNALPTRESKEMYWLPNANLRYKTLSFNYNKNVSHPQMYSIQSVDNTVDEMGVSRAFPYAENMISDEFRLNLYKYFNNYKNQLNVYANYSHNNYSFGYKIKRDLTTGRYENQAYIAPENSNFSAGLNYSQQIKLSETWELRISQNLSSYIYDNYRTINDIENKDRRWSNSINQELTFSWKNIALSPKYSLNYSKNLVSTDDPNFRDSETISHSFTAGLNINNLKHFSLETSYSLTAYKGGYKANPIVNIVNASLYYDMMNKGQIKLSVFDLLNQNVNIHNGSSHNSNYYYESSTLKQYFLLGYVYKFNKAKMK